MKDYKLVSILRATGLMTLKMVVMMMMMMRKVWLSSGQRVTSFIDVRNADSQAFFPKVSRQNTRTHIRTHTFASHLN